MDLGFFLTERGSGDMHLLGFENNRICSALVGRLGLQSNKRENLLVRLMVNHG